MQLIDISLNVIYKGRIFLITDQENALETIVTSDIGAKIVKKNPAYKEHQPNKLYISL